MKIKGTQGYTTMVCMIWLFAGVSANAGSMGAEVLTPTDAIYIGGFGGGGGGPSTSLVQQGTALYNYNTTGSSIDNGGPLAVNAFGQSNSLSTWIAGGQVGYRWSERGLNHLSSNWRFAPATELEGYYLGQSNIQGMDLNNETTRLVEHDFHVTLPMNTGVFLVNAILQAHHADWAQFHPYVGIGAGAALVSISGAVSSQTTPPEVGINHFNSDTKSSSLVLAAQPKVGVSYHFGERTNVFVEYRFLYLSATDFTFGSTVYSTHVATTNWDMKVDSQYLSMGTAGIQFDL